MSSSYEENRELGQALTLLKVAEGLLGNASRIPIGDYLRDRERDWLLDNLKAVAEEIGRLVRAVAGETTP